MSMIKRGLSAGCALVLAALLGACGGGGSDTTSSSMGSLRVALTDAPACGYDHVNVTVTKVRINQSATASDTDAGWTDVTLQPAQRFDLVTLTNGVLAELGQTPLPPGKYTQMRLVLQANDSSTPLANSVQPTGGAEQALVTPSGQQSGVKMNVDIDVAANQMADLVLDFDACKSIVRAGNSGRYLLKPVVSVIPRYVSGVQGYVDAALVGSASVSLQQNGSVVRATAPDASGKFLLQPVAPGTYDLVVTAPGRATTVVTDVTVAADTVTSLNSAATQLTLAASTTGTAAGTVTTGSTPVDASVTVQQTVAGTHLVELATGAVDPTSGAYSDDLPTAAPMVAAYAAAPATLSFSADATAAGKVQLKATAADVSKTAGPITLAPSTTVTTNFSFP